MDSNDFSNVFENLSLKLKVFANAEILPKKLQLLCVFGEHGILVHHKVKSDGRLSQSDIGR